MPSISQLSDPSHSHTPYHVGGVDGVVLGRALPGGSACLDDSSREMKRPAAQARADAPTSIPPPSLRISSTPEPEPAEWHFQPGTYTPHEIVLALAPLLNSVVTRLGPDPPGEVPARQILIDGVLSSLSIDKPQASLPLSPAVTDLSRREMAAQAVKIGKQLVQWAEQAPVVPTVIKLRSRCDGHIWTPATGALLRGPRSDNQQMQLYNEWQNQMILLRDALLPFNNFEEVLLVLRADKGRKGLRDFAELRERFMLQCLTKKMEQNMIVDVAKAFTGPNLPSGGYGLQYSEGLILPAYLSGCASLHLLQYHPARLDDSLAEILFVYEYEDYYSAARTQISDPVATVRQGIWPPASSSRLSSRRSVMPSIVVTSEQGDDPQLRFLKLELELENGATALIDVGQITRGRRYAYHVHDLPAQLEATTLSTTVGLSKPSLLHNPIDILTLPGLVTDTDDNWHVIPAVDPVVRLALLGKLYPENVVTLSAKQPPRSAETIGKGYGPRFIIYGGECNEQNVLIG